MGLLIGLPLKLFHLLFVIVRLAWPVLMILLVLYLVRRLKGQQVKKQPRQEKVKEPEFRGPVYTVDYTEVDDAEDQT